VTALADAHRPLAPRAWRACATRRHLLSAAAQIERELPGLAALGSLYGSVRASDGLCRVHDRYLSASSSCAAFEASGATAR
jgi:hypothetical protein